MNDPLPQQPAGRPLSAGVQRNQLHPGSEQWLADHVQLAGRLALDAGAVRALVRDGKSLLPIGVIRVDGNFERGEIVGCFDPDGREVARGLVNYSAPETARILRKPSSEIAAILGYSDEPELIHRNNLVLLG